ncbi:MAG: Zn-dependent membrane protease YugP [Limisphaerales bacterium]|jgi:Zn-dependent membrane protease YugP
MMTYYIITILFGLLGKMASGKLQSRFKEYSAMPTESGLSGKEIAEKMLRDSGITDVKVVSVKGALTDHYNPSNKTVNLSDWVYDQRNVAATAVAAHEVGHAVQHANSYTWLTMRSKMVPAVQFSSKIMMFVIMGGLAVSFFSGNPIVLGIGVAMFAGTTLFSIVTLPVEYDASDRALAWMNTSGVVGPQQHGYAEDALKWAARTYVVGAIASIGQLVYFLSLFMGSRR